MNGKGFKFSFSQDKCRICGAFCCKGEGYVFLSEKDPERIASYLGVDVDTFLKLYTKHSEYPGRITLINIKTKGEVRCVFLDDDNRCEIYPVRPKQCRTFPFWESLREKDVDFVRMLCPFVEDI